MLTIIVITMKNNSHKQKKESKSVEKLKRSAEKSSQLIDRLKRKQDTEKLIINIVKSEANLTIAQVVEKSGLSRSNFNYYLNGLIERKIIVKKRQEDIHGRPTFLNLNIEYIKERDEFFKKSWESYEEFNLKSICSDNILREIEEHPDYEQHQELIKLMKLHKKESYGAKVIFLLHSGYIKIDYKFSLTEKGEKALEKIKKKIPKIN